MFYFKRRSKLKKLDEAIREMLNTSITLEEFKGFILEYKILSGEVAKLQGKCEAFEEIIRELQHKK